MENRQCVQQHVGGGKAPVIHQCQGVGQQVIVAQHRAFRQAGGSRGIQNRCQVVRRALDIGEFRDHIFSGRHQAATAVAVERQHPGLDAVELGFAIASADKHCRLGILEEIFDLCSRIGGIEWQKHGAGAHRGEVQGNSLYRLGHLHRHAIAGFDALRLQQVSQPAA